MGGNQRPVDLSPEQLERGKKIRMGKLEAKLKKPLDPKQRVEVEAQLKREKDSSSCEKPPPPPPSEEARLVSEADLKEVVDTFVSLSALTGYPLVCSDLAIRNLTGGLTKMARRKGWNMAQLGEWVLIGSGIGLIAVQTAVSWVNIIKEKNKEAKNAPQIQPDAAGGPDGGG